MSDVLTKIETDQHLIEKVKERIFEIRQIPFVEKEPKRLFRGDHTLIHRIQFETEEERKYTSEEFIRTMNYLYPQYLMDPKSPGDANLGRYIESQPDRVKFNALRRNDIVVYKDDEVISYGVVRSESDALNEPPGAAIVEWTMSRANAPLELWAPSMFSRGLYYLRKAHLVLRVRSSLTTAEDLFYVGHHFLGLFRAYLEEEAEGRDKEISRIGVKLRINSPGEIAFVHVDLNLIVMMALFLVALAGGSINFDIRGRRRNVRLNISTFSLLERMRRFLYVGKNEVVAKSIKRLMEKNMVETPHELIDLLKELQEEEELK